MNESGRLTIRDRLELLGEARAAGVPLVATLTVLMAAERLLPAALAAATALLVGEAVPATDQPVLAGAGLALAVYGIVLLGEHALEAVSGPLEYAVKARIDGRRRTSVLRHATAGPTLDRLERPEVQEQIRLARAEPGNWTESTPGDGVVAILAMLTTMLGTAASCLVVAQVAWWLVPVLLVPAVTGRVLVSRHLTAYVGQWRRGIGYDLRAQVWSSMLSAPESGKEVRLYGLAPLAAARMRANNLARFEPVWAVGLRGMRANWYRFGLTAAGLGAGYAVAALYTVQGRIDVATEAAVFAAGWSVFIGLFGYDPLPVLGALPGQRAYRDLAREPAGEGATEGGGSAAPEGEARAPAPVAGPPRVRFEETSFRYPGTDVLVLDRLCLEIRPGELLAIVGLNGAGKSTLIKLLAGLYRPTTGRITADGADIWATGVRHWRSRIAVVFQDFLRYPLPARDNVALARGRTPEEDGGRHDAALAEAARDAGLDEVVDRLPEGWLTPLTRTRRGGVDLSGGQWQKVALARALYAGRAGAGLLVLDEPTAHLDVRTEFEVFERLAARRGRQGVVLISHRLSTVRRADRIVFLHAGRVAEEGSHAELMAAGGRYARLFAIQAERFAAGHDDRFDGVEP